MLVPFGLGLLWPANAVITILGAAPLVDGIAALVASGNPAAYVRSSSFWVESVFLCGVAGILTGFAWRGTARREGGPALAFYTVAMSAVLAVSVAGYASTWRGQFPLAAKMMWLALPFMDQASGEHVLRAGLVQLAAGLWLWVVRNVSWEPVRVRLAWNVWMASSIIVAAYGTWMWLRGVGEHWPRVGSVFEDVNSYGSYLVLTLFVAVAIWLSARSRLGKVLASAALIVTAWMLLLAGSRSAFVAALLGLIAVAAFCSAKKAWPVAFAAVVVCVAAAIVSGWVGSRPLVKGMPVQIGQLGNPKRVFEFFQENRWPVWQAVGRALSEHPVFGIGPGLLYKNIDKYYRADDRGWRPAHENAHNYFLQVAAEDGILGLAALVWLVCWGIRSGPSTPPGRRALAIGATAYLLTALTGHPLILSRQVILFWGFVGLIPLSFGAPQWTPASGRRKIARFGVLALLLILMILVAMRHRPRECPVSSNGGEVVASGFSMGFYASEGSTKEAWRWMRDAGELVLCNQSKARLVADMRLRMQSFDVARSLTLYSAGESLAVFRVTPSPTDFTVRRVILNPGATRLILTPLPGPQVVDTVAHTGDPRRVSVRVWEPVTWTPSH